MEDLPSKNGLEARSDYLLQWLDAETDADVDDSQLTANGGTPAGGEDDQGFAARLYRLCLHALQEVYIQERGKRTFGSQSIGLRECLGRLYLWGESFGSGELDKALEESDDLKESVLERLGHIGKFLLRATKKAPSQGLLQPSKENIELELLIKQIKDVISGYEEQGPTNGGDSDEEYDSGTEGSSDGENYDLCEDIGFSITCLTELRTSLEQNLARAEKNRIQNAHPPPLSFCLSDPAKIYVSLVREKFQQAQDQLVERLGQANWQRHVGVRKRIESNISIVEEVPEPACSIFRPYSTFHDSGIGTSVPSRTIYAPSHTSFISSNTEGGQNSLRVPPMPSEVGAGKPFQCDFCGMFLTSIKNRVEWKMHVFADLQPYICTFANCEDKLAQFPTRAAWSDHEFAEHRITQRWSCPECPETYTRSADWEDHLQWDHQCVFTVSKLQVALGMALRKKSRTAENEVCPLCRTMPGKPRRAFVKHVGRHMEDIALMALPRNPEDDSDEGSISSNENSIPAVDGEMASTVPGDEERVGQEEFYAVTKRVLNILRDYAEITNPFLTPVNRNETPDYHEVIKTPMDLGTIIEKLDRYQYKSRNAFISDLNLCWVNCLKYNTTQGHPLRKMALAMRHKIEDLVPSIPEIVVFRESPRSRGLPRIEVALYDDEDSDYESIMSSQGQPALGSGSKLWEDRSASESFKPLPQTIGSQDVPQGVFYTTSPKHSYPFASSDDHSEGYETPVHGAATHRNPLLSPWAESKATLQQPKKEVEGSISPANKKHQCPYCSAFFTRHHNLKSHLLTHSQDRPYSCDNCGTRFRRLHDLKRHSNMHHLELSYMCPKCNRTFTHKDDFISHTKNGCSYVGGTSPVRDISSEDELHEIRKSTTNYGFPEKNLFGDLKAGDEGRGRAGYSNYVKSTKELLLAKFRGGVDDMVSKPEIRMPPGGAPTDSWDGNEWSLDNDQTLLRAREEGLDCHAIVSQIFPERTANALRNQHTVPLARNELVFGDLSDYESPSTKQQDTIMQPKASQVYAQKLAKSPSHNIPTQEQSSQRRPDSLGAPTSSPPKDSLLDQNTVQNYAEGFLSNKSTSHKGERQQGDRNGQHHPSLTRERHPIYGNSIFSENRSVYRTDDTSDRFTNEFERDAAKESTLPTYTYPGGRRKGQKTRSASVDLLENLKWSQEPSDATIAAASGSAYTLKSLMYGDEVEQSENSPELLKCSHTDYFDQAPLFSRRSESAKHMDLHTRPYLCVEPECNNLLGFTYPGGLLRHQREVHGLHGASKARFFCKHLDCERSTGVGFSRMDNLTDHMMRIHDAPEEELRKLQPKVQADDELKGQSKRVANPPPTPSRPMRKACRSPRPSKEDQVQEGDRTPKPRSLKRYKQRILTPAGRDYAKAIRQFPGGPCEDCKRKKAKCIH